MTRASVDRPLYLKNVVWQSPCPWRNYKRVKAEQSRPCQEVFLERRTLSILGLSRGKRDHVSRASLYPGFPRSLPYTVIRLGMPRGPSSYILGLIPSDGTYRRHVPRPYYLNLSSRVVLVSFGLAESKTQGPGEANQPGNGHAQPQPQNYRLVNYTKAQNIRIAAPGRVRSNDVERESAKAE